MFFLPLPLKKTVKTLEEVNEKTDGAATGLPNPELFIIVNSKSETKFFGRASLTSVHSEMLSGN